MTLTEYFEKCKHIESCLTACWFNNAYNYRSWKKEGHELNKDSLVFLFGSNIAAGRISEEGYMGGIYNLGECTEEKKNKIRTLCADLNLSQGRHTIDLDKLEIIERED